MFLPHLEFVTHFGEGKLTVPQQFATVLATGYVGCEQVIENMKLLHGKTLVLSVQEQKCQKHCCFRALPGEASARPCVTATCRKITQISEPPFS